MWPFTSRQSQLAAAALAPGALPSAREKAMQALMALPPKPESLACYLTIALDQKQVWKTRYKALEGMKRHPTPDGARALLQCAATDLRSSVLSFLGAEGMPAALRSLGSGGISGLSEVLRRISAESGKRHDDLLLGQLDTLQKLLVLVASPEAQALLPAVQELTARLQNALIPKFLEHALTSKYHREVKEAVEVLEKLDSPAAAAALAQFRRVPSRLVEKYVPPGIGAPPGFDGKLQVYTSEFGQPKCDAELARDAALAADWARRHPEKPPEAKPVTAPDHAGADSAAPDPGPAAAPEPDDVHPQYYAAGSARGIEEELLALVDNQIGLLKSLHAKGSLAPLAAAMDARGEINGFALTTKDGARESADKSVEEVIEFFREQFRQQARAGAIVGCAVFFHGCHGPGKGAIGVALARNVDEADCLVALLDHRDGQAAACVIQYRRDPSGAWKYDPPYYVPNARTIFVDAAGKATGPNAARDPRLARRPAAAGDRGVHPELMTLLESQSKLLTSLHAAGSPAPLAAWMKPSGEIQTGLVFNRDVWETYAIETDLRDSIVLLEDRIAEKSPADAVAFFVARLRQAAEQGEIVASAIFYHGSFDPDLVPLGIMPALNGDVPDCIVAQLDHRLSQAMSVVMRYNIAADGTCQYPPTLAFSNYPLIFNEGGGSYAEHMAMKLTEALRDLGTRETPAAPGWWEKRLRTLLPAAPIARAELDAILEPMTLAAKIKALDLLVRLGRTEVGPGASGLFAAATGSERSALAEILIKCGEPFG